MSDSYNSLTILKAFELDKSLLEFLTSDIQTTISGTVDVIYNAVSSIAQYILTPLIQTLKFVVMSNLALEMAEASAYAVSGILSALQDASNMLISLIDSQLQIMNQKSYRLATLLSAQA